MNERDREARENAETMLAPSRLTRLQLAVLALFLVLPLLLIAAKASDTPAAAFLLQHFSFTGIPLQHAMRHVLLVPLGAILVVLFRLTLGVQVLGPFRPTLIAFAFQLTGILPGLLFLVLIVALILSIRPLNQGAAATLLRPYQRHAERGYGAAGGRDSGRQGLASRRVAGYLQLPCRGLVSCLRSFRAHHQIGRRGERIVARRDDGHDRGLAGVGCGNSAPLAPPVELPRASGHANRNNCPHIQVLRMAYFRQPQSGPGETR